MRKLHLAGPSRVRWSNTKLYLYSLFLCTVIVCIILPTINTCTSTFNQVILGGGRNRGAKGSCHVPLPPSNIMFEGRLPNNAIMEPKAAAKALIYLIVLPDTIVNYLKATIISGHKC